MSHWIDINDHLPEYNYTGFESDPVLLLTVLKTPVTVVRTRIVLNSKEETWKWSYNNGKSLSHTMNPTHWMPIPDMPKGKVNNGMV